LRRSRSRRRSKEEQEGEGFCFVFTDDGFTRGTSFEEGHNGVVGFRGNGVRLRWGEDTG